MEYNKWGLQVPLNVENITNGETSKVILNRQPDVSKLRYIDVRKDGKMIRMYAPKGK